MNTKSSMFSVGLCLAIFVVFLLVASCETIKPASVAAPTQAPTAAQAPAAQGNDILIPTGNGIQITATTYLTDDASAPYILLAHRAKWSRGEYIEIAPKLNELGFNCIAIDQRSGGSINGVKNATAALATSKFLGTEFIDALVDIQSAVKYVEATYAPTKLILWGSSYSAALSIVVTGEMSDVLDALVLFSPGEYFAKQGKSDTWIRENAKKVQCPVFITAAKNEESQIRPLFNAFTAKDKQIFVPSSYGKHGSEALFTASEGHEEYWQAITVFLKSLL